jgi:aldose 1-epimerase
LRAPRHAVHWLNDGQQRLGLIPSLGGSVAAWQLLCLPGAPHSNPLEHPTTMPFDLWRPWSGADDLYATASFPLLPWSNRVSQGGFEHAGQFHPLRPNRAGEPFPIHGEGWLQPWVVSTQNESTIDMRLQSHAFLGSPFHYEASQRYELKPDGIDQTLTVVHTGEQPLPYGVGQHPWLLRTSTTRMRAQVAGVWLAGPDGMPVEHARRFSDRWDLSKGVLATGSPIDNAFTGWSGLARVDWPDAGVHLTLSVVPSAAEGHDGHCLVVYRPREGPCFCMEPVTHPVDAIHLPGQPGLKTLQPGEALSLHLRWRFGGLPVES